MNRILVIQTASIGDVILATALLESLHSAFPAAAIDLLVKKGNEPLFDEHPFLNEVLTWNKRSGKFRDLSKIIRHLRRSHYDLLVNIQRFFITGLVTVLSGAKETRGFSKNPLSFLFTKSMKHLIGTGIHEVTRNHALIEDLVVSASALPRIYPSASEESFADSVIKGEFYTVSPASLWFTKQYPPERWVKLIREIPARYGIFLLGSHSDHDLCEEIRSMAGHPGLINLAGTLSFLQAAALMKRARMNFTNDSAPMHLASAVNAKVTAIFCSTVPEFGFGPLSDNSTVVEITEKLACRPCGIHGYKACPEKHFKCAYNINIEHLTRVL